MSKGQTLQDPFLNALRREKIPVAIYLVNGIKLQGHVESFDQYVIMLKNSVNQMVYKHAISTVVPAKAVRYNCTHEHNDNEHTPYPYGAQEGSSSVQGRDPGATGIPGSAPDLMSE